MTTATGKYTLLFVLGVCVTVACNDDYPSATTIGPPQKAFDGNMGNDEGELLGNIFVNGVRNTAVGFTVTLLPFDQTTKNRLTGPEKDGSVYVVKGGGTGYGGKHFDFQWSDPASSGVCGTLSEYYSPSYERQVEIHTSEPNPGKEIHCIRPGIYRLTITGPGMELPKSFVIQFYQHSGVSVDNQKTGGKEIIEALEYALNSRNGTDLIAHVEVVPGNYAETANVDIENAGADPYKPTFNPAPFPHGTTADYFRFSLARSKSYWDENSTIEENSLGADMLARIFFDEGQNNAMRSEYFDPDFTGVDAGRTLLVRRYNKLTSSRVAKVGVELMLPDEMPEQPPVVKDSVHITYIVPPVDPAPADTACFAAEAHETYRNTDQYLNAACSSDRPGLQYRWSSDGGANFSPFTTDTIHDFLGHAASGVRNVMLEILNPATGVISSEIKNIHVLAGTLDLAGPTFIQDKAKKIYTSSVSSQFYDRGSYEWTWVRATLNATTTYQRIWPAGDYVVYLRAEDPRTYDLRRGRLKIQVCNPSCNTGNFRVAAVPSAENDTSNWSFFGGGPVLTWNSGPVTRWTRLYELTGTHDIPSGFERSDWLNASSGNVSLPDGGTSISWRRLATSAADTRAFEFIMSPGPVVGDYNFGFSWDPDIGSNAADDVSGYDPSLGLLYAADNSGAVGLLVRQNNANALYGVREYGVGRHTPQNAPELYRMMRRNAFDLVTKPRDVQFIVSTQTRSDGAVWQVLFVKAKSLSELKKTAALGISSLPN